MGHQSARAINLEEAMDLSACSMWSRLSAGHDGLRAGVSFLLRKIKLCLVRQPLLVAIPFQSCSHSLPQGSLGLKSELGGGAGRIAYPVALAGVENLITRQDAGPSCQTREKV